MDTKSVYIIDSMSVSSWFKSWFKDNHLSMYYIDIPNNMKVVMELVNSTWNGNIYMWRRISLTWVLRTLD